MFGNRNAGHDAGQIRVRVDRWNPPVEFVDSQLEGPYAEWVHRHRFIELSRHATLIEDRVRFRLPFERLGSLAGPIVRRELRRIFDFRRDAIARLTARPPGDTA
jgi:ligand-binding SRPBCC domain-containing protein